MIPIPPNVVRGQVLTADLVNQIVGTLRRLRLIPGEGVRLEETSQGVRINATAKAVQQTTTVPEAVAPQDWDLRADVASGLLQVYHPVPRKASFTSNAQTYEDVAPDGSLTEGTDGWWSTTLNLAELGTSAPTVLVADWDGDAVSVRKKTSADEPRLSGKPPTEANRWNLFVVGSVTVTVEGEGEAQKRTYAITQANHGVAIDHYPAAGAATFAVLNTNGKLVRVTPGQTLAADAALRYITSFTRRLEVGGKHLLAYSQAFPEDRVTGLAAFAEELAVSHTALHTGGRL